MTSPSKYRTVIADDEQPARDTGVFFNAKTQNRDFIIFASLRLRVENFCPSIQFD